MNVGVYAGFECVAVYGAPAHTCVETVHPRNRRRALRCNNVSYRGLIFVKLGADDAGACIDLGDPPALRAGYPFEQTRIQSFPRGQKQAVLGKAVLGVKQ